MEIAGPGRERDFTAEASKVPVRDGEFRNLYEAELLVRDGWAMRSYPCGCNHQIADHRTVGLQENFDHPDVQIFYPMNSQLALGILGTIADLVKTGGRFESGDTSDDVLEGFIVRFVSTNIDGVDMLRVILPDKEGRLLEGEIAHPYSNQYKEL